MRRNYFSDVHLEFGPLPAPDNDADLVIAAGDIGIGRQGVEWLKTINKPVIYIAGNHEFYMHEYKQTLAALRTSCAGTNIFFLEKEVLIFQKVRFIACTLWTDLLKRGDLKAYEVSLRLNDFKTIRFKDGVFNQFAFTQLHRHSLLWLENKLSEPFDGKTIVITHHAPSPLSWCEPPNDLKKMAYCNDLEELIKHHSITAWFHGHIHCPNDYMVAGTRILSNPRGYYGRKAVENFDPNKIVEL